MVVESLFESECQEDDFGVNLNLMTRYLLPAPRAASQIARNFMYQDLGDTSNSSSFFLLALLRLQQQRMLVSAMVVMDGDGRCTGLNI